MLMITIHLIRKILDLTGWQNAEENLFPLLTINFECSTAAPLKGPMRTN
jgi:hypothetical protein